MRRRCYLMAVVCCLSFLSIVAAQAAEAPAKAEPIGLAVLKFECEDKELADKITDFLTARLSVDPKFILVERQRLDTVLSELKLGLAGLIDPADAYKIGRLTGAKILIMGRAFIIDDELFIVARIVGTETSRVYAELVRGSVTEKLVPILDGLTDKIQGLLGEKASSLIATGKPVDREEQLKELCAKLEGKALPKVFVAVSEVHYGVPVDRDPAAETELILWLKRCGFTVIDAGKEKMRLGRWAIEYFKHTDIEIPKIIDREVRLIVVGEAIGEFGTRIGDLVSSKGRVEVRAIERETGKILAIGRKTVTAVDLSEQIAAKKAIQEAAADIAYELIPKIIKEDKK